MKLILRRFYRRGLPIGLALFFGAFPGGAVAKTSLRPEVKHVFQVENFPIRIPGVRAAELFKTETVDMILTHGEPGTRLHKHSLSDHFVYILKGKGEARLGNERRPLGEGDLVLIPKEVPHSILKTGKTEFVFLAISSPPLDPGDFVWLEKEPSAR